MFYFLLFETSFLHLPIDPCIRRTSAVLSEFTFLPVTHGFSSWSPQFPPQAHQEVNVGARAGNRQELSFKSLRPGKEPVQGPVVRQQISCI